MLITGHQGYIGSEVIQDPWIISQGFEGCDLKRGKDYRNIAGRKFDTVIHLAAGVSVIESFKNASEYIANNATGVRNFLWNNEVRRFILISTGGAMYGDKLEAKETDADRRHLMSPYAISKFEAEIEVRAALPDSHVILRLGNVYGGNDNVRGEAACFQHFKQDNPIVIYGGSQIRDFVNVGAVTHAIVKALTSNVCGTFNIGTGLGVGVKFLAEHYGRTRNVPVEYRPKREGEVEFITLDVSKAREAGLL